MIVLKDMKFSVLKSLIEFMYCGETNVTEDNLHALVEAAKFFEVIYSFIYKSLILLIKINIYHEKPYHYN